MAKSTDELKLILKRMQERLEKIPPSSEPKPESVPAQPAPRPLTSQGPAPVNASEPPTVKSARPGPRPRPQAEAGSEQTPRLLRDDEPIPQRRNLEEFTRLKRPAPASFFRFAALGTAIGVGLAGLFIDSRALVFMGFVGLAVGAAWPVASHDAAELQEMTVRIAALERRVSSLSLPGPSGRVSAGLAEELEELRTMVKSLYKAIEEAPIDSKGDEDEGLARR